MMKNITMKKFITLLAFGLVISSPISASASHHKITTSNKQNDISWPIGSTAQCNDSTFSYSRTHSGTCSHHGGVATFR
jgi:hypothetical protein